MFEESVVPALPPPPPVDGNGPHWQRTDWRKVYGNHSMMSKRGGVRFIRSQTTTSQPQHKGGSSSMTSRNETCSNPTRNGQFYKTKLCQWHERNCCRMSDLCNYAHTETDLRRPPDLSCTRLCSKLYTEGSCDNPNCRFAHDPSELRATDEFYKTRLCRLWHFNACSAGSQCRHAHGLGEMRVVSNGGNSFKSASPAIPEHPSAGETNEAADRLVGESSMPEGLRRDLSGEEKIKSANSDEEAFTARQNEDTLLCPEGSSTELVEANETISCCKATAPLPRDDDSLVSLAPDSRGGGKHYGYTEKRFGQPRPSGESGGRSYFGRMGRMPSLSGSRGPEMGHQIALEIRGAKAQPNLAIGEGVSLTNGVEVVPQLSPATMSPPTHHPVPPPLTIPLNLLSCGTVFPCAQGTPAYLNGYVGAAVSGIAIMFAALCVGGHLTPPPLLPAAINLLAANEVTTSPMMVGGNKYGDGIIPSLCGSLPAAVDDSTQFAVEHAVSRVCQQYSSGSTASSRSNGSCSTKTGGGDVTNRYMGQSPAPQECEAFSTQDLVETDASVTYGLASSGGNSVSSRPPGVGKNGHGGLMGSGGSRFSITDFPPLVAIPDRVGAEHETRSRSLECFHAYDEFAVEEYED